MLGKDFAEGLIDNWDVLVRGSRRATEFLAAEHVFDRKRLPSDTVVPMLIALWTHAPDGLDQEGEARRLLSRFMWRAFFTDRYELSTNSRTLSDYRLLRSMVAGQPCAMPPIFDTESYPLPSVDELMVAGWPKNRDRLAKAIMLLSLRGGGLDFADEKPASRDNLAHREYHHIFPQAYLARQGITENSRVSRALNCALVTWKTNRKMSDKAPVDYIADRIDSSNEEVVERRLASHGINLASLSGGVYEEFLRDRAETLAPSMNELAG